MTTAVDARPDYVLALPHPTWIPMITAILVTVCFVSLTFKATSVALVAAVLIIPMLYLWVWRTPAPVDEVVDIGRGLTLPAFVSGPRSVLYSGVTVSLIFDAIAFGALVFSYLYLFTVRGLPWPPAGYPLDDLATAGIPALLAIALLAVGMLALRLLRQDRRGLTGMAVAVALALQAGAFAALLAWMRPISATADAYGATVWTLAGYAMAHLAVSAIMAVYVLIALAAGRLSAGRPLALENTARVNRFSALLMLITLALISLFPRMIGHG